MEKQYLFVEMSVWKKAIAARTVMQIFHLSKTYRIIMTEVQLEELKLCYFGKEYYLVKDLCNNSEKENAENFAKLTKTHPKLADYYYNFHILIYEHIYTILKYDESYEELANDRIFDHKPPFYSELEYTGDVFSWISIILSSKIEEKYDLYIYTNTTNFLFNKEIHPILCFDWKVYKKGILRLFDKLKAPVEYRTTDNLTAKKIINKNSPQYMTQRFTNLSDLLVTEFAKKYPEITEIQTILQECKFIVERLKFNISDEILLIMKKKVSHFGLKYEELLNDRKLIRQNRLIK